MSVFSNDLNNIRQRYDTSNPLLAKILQAKEDRLKLLHEYNKQHQEELKSLKLDLIKENSAKKSNPKPKKQSTGFPQIALRRSTRLENSPKINFRERDQSPEYTPSKPPTERPPNAYGPMPGVGVGFHWETRLDCSRYGVHRPTVAGIHGGPDGAYSIALSGGYPEDVDEGDSFIYTGAGGRDLKGTASNPKNLRIAPQTKNQELEGTNLSLVKSIESKLPIRVIRGYKSPSIYAPKNGYRYDGLYQVVDYWEDIGTTGFRVYRFKMVRMKDQGLAPWEEGFCYYQPDNSNTEDKENIPISNLNVDDNEMKEVDNEIQTCVNFFFKTKLDDDKHKLDDNAEQFAGWD